MRRLGLLVVATVLSIAVCIPCIVMASSREAFRAAAAVPAELVLVILVLVVVLAVIIIRR